MKQKIILRIVAIFLVLMFYVLLNPVKNYAITSSGDYSINSYDINMIVNENNTFDITETITVNFTDYKHGIFRKIPLRNKVERTDGTKSSNRAIIKNLSVNEQYTEFTEDGYKVLKIGQTDKEIIGEKTYIIKYNYNIGKDPLKDADELYFNLIGNQWDAEIGKVTFSIKMPKKFDKTKLGFSMGYGGTSSSSVNYKVLQNVIEGSIKHKLFPGQGLTVRLTLPDGYFVGASNNWDYYAILKVAVCIICIVVAFILWYKYGRDSIPVDMVEFYPPDDLNSAELGFIYKGVSDNKDIVSLLIGLANKGYLRIEEFEEKVLMFKNKDFKIIKLKDYDGDNENERIFGLCRDRFWYIRDNIFLFL